MFVSEPKVKPSLSNDISLSVSLNSAPVPSEKRALFAPRTESNKLGPCAARDLIQTRSGVKPTSRTGRIELDPLHVTHPNPVGVWSAPASHAHATYSAPLALILTSSPIVMPSELNERTVSSSADEA